MTEQIRALRDALAEGLVEREVPVRLALLAALSGEHLLLLGPPGTAKSMIAARLRTAFREAGYFERLLTRFTVPEELFGPLSIRGLEEDRYERLTDSYLPSASIAFLDEIFKANSAILNALLTLLNEREFDNGTRRVPTPLITVVGASNELPEGDELRALYDRFLLRAHVGPVSKEGFSALLGLRGSASSPADGLTLSRADLTAVQKAAEQVTVPDDVLALLAELREFCAAESIDVSDRRWRKVLRLLQVSALTNGQPSVTLWDCWLLQHCLWQKPEERQRLYDWYAERVGASAALDPARITRVVASWEGRLKRNREERSQMQDSRGRLLFVSADGKYTTQPRRPAQRTREGEPLYFAHPDARITSHGNSIRDRTNGGLGYTESELDKHYVGYHEAFRSWSGRGAYLADQANWLMEDADLPPAMEPKRHSPAYVRDCNRELEQLQAEISRYRAKLASRISSLEREIAGHLWVTSDFAAPASSSLRQTLAAVESLLTRVGALHAGFEALPLEEDLPPGLGDSHGDAEVEDEIEPADSAAGEDRSAEPAGSA